jgi:hypothetical protein
MLNNVSKQTSVRLSFAQAPSFLPKFALAELTDQSKME